MISNVLSTLMNYLVVQGGIRIDLCAWDVQLSTSFPEKVDVILKALRAKQLYKVAVC